MRLPRANDRPSAQPRHGHRHPEALPRRVVRPQADLRPRPVRPAARAHATSSRSTTTSTRAAGLWFTGDVGTGKTSLAMLVSAGGRARGALGGDLPGDAPAGRDQGHLRPRGRRLLHGALPAALLGRPAPPRRPRRREAHRVGARAALLDRQRALAGPSARSSSPPTSPTSTRCASSSARAPSRGSPRSAASRSRSWARTCASRPAAERPTVHSKRHARTRDSRRPVGRRGQGKGRRPARRAGRCRDPLPGRQQRRPHDRPRAARRSSST